MRPLKFYRALPLAAVVSLAAVLADAAEPVSPAAFEKLHALIAPDAGEDQWTQIPWRTSLWEARVEAARQGKPILLWEMDGHPLGCT
ncbi:MAG: hypothetical protein KY476_04255 [Planctomycetes bacterium]|nr:hypothetical protein [Planctomycetota bacterium]